MKPGRTKGRAPWTAMIHEHVQIRQAIEASTASRPCVKSMTSSIGNRRALASSRVNFATIPRRKGPITFGTVPKEHIDPDRIRMTMEEYDKQKGQNLEQLFRPKKGCFRCIIL